MPRHPAVHFAAPTPRPNLHRTAITLPMYDLALPFGLPTPAPLDFFETFYILPFPIRPGLFNIWVHGSLSFREWPAAGSPPPWPNSSYPSLEETLAAKRKKNGVVRCAPLRATCRWTKFIFRCLEILGKPKAFDIYAPDPEKAAILAECKVGPLTAASRTAVSQWKAPPVLTVASDQEQIQISGANFMKCALGLMMVLFRDFFHRLHNDFATAMSKAGFMPIFFAAIVI